jgi:hypothetical protein
MKVWAKTKEWWQGKFLVVRRDGTVPNWPHFVIGAKDPCAARALLAYADAAHELGFDPEYVGSVRELAKDFEQYVVAHGNGNPDAGPHRNDDPNVLIAMGHQWPLNEHSKPTSIVIRVRPDA